MKYYCTKCGAESTPEEIYHEKNDGLGVCPHCKVSNESYGQPAVLCSWLMKRRSMPLIDDCDSCKLRFKCFTNSLY